MHNFHPLAYQSTYFLEELDSLLLQNHFTNSSA